MSLLAPIKLTLYINSNRSNDSVNFKKGCIGTVPIHINFVHNNAPFVLTSGTVAKVRMCRPDKIEVFNDCTVQGNNVILDITEQMQEVPGDGKCEIILIHGGKPLTSSTFIIKIGPNVHDDKQIEDSPEYNTLLNALVRIENAIPMAEQAYEVAMEAQNIVDDIQVTFEGMQADVATALVDARVATNKANNAIGPQGPKGNKGDTGDTGATGPQGLKGDKGDIGATGPKGDKGDAGPQGTQGIKGDKGDIGPQGPQGIQGATGPQGLKGDKGDTGPQGPKGDKGLDGTGSGNMHTSTYDKKGVGVDIFDYADSKATYSDKATALTGNLITCPNADDGIIELLSVSAPSKQAVSVQGKNEIPSQIQYWESGEYSSSSGHKLDNAKRIRLKNLIRVSPSQNYYFNTNNTSTHNIQFTIRTYGVNGLFLRSAGAVTSPNGNYVPLADEYYIGVTIISSSDTVLEYAEFQTLFNTGLIKPFMCLNSVTDKTYEPFTPNSPSPDYPSPITVPSSVELTATNINPLPKFSPTTASGITMTVSEDGTITLNGTNTSGATMLFHTPMYLPMKTGESYTLNANNPLANAEVHLRLSKTTGGEAFQDANLQMSNINAIKTFTLTEDGSPVRLSIRIGANQTLTNFIIKPQLQKGSVATPYTPPQSNKITISKEFGSVQDGTKNETDFITNKHILRVMTKVFDGSADENIVLRNMGNGTDTISFTFNNTGVISNISKNRIMCSHFSYSGPSTDGIEGVASGTSNDLFLEINRSRLSSLDVIGFKAWLSANPITISFQLATPIITDLTPDIRYALRSYKGVTNLFATNDAVATVNFKSELWSRDCEQDALLNNGLYLSDDTTVVSTVPTDSDLLGGQPKSYYEGLVNANTASIVTINNKLTATSPTINISTTNTNYTISGVKVYKKNGWCVVAMTVVCNTVQSGSVYTISGSNFPKSLIDTQCATPCQGTASFLPVMSMVNTNGDLIVRLGTSGGTYYPSWTYPCVD